MLAGAAFALALGAFAVAAPLSFAATAPSPGSGFHVTAPTRVLDTRAGGGAVAAGSTTVLDLSPYLPADASAVSVNITVSAPTAGGYIEAYADGSARPVASTVNFSKSATIANSSIVQLLNGKIDLFNSSGGTVQLIADMTGYFEPPAPAPAPTTPPPSASGTPSSPAPSPSGTSGTPTPSASGGSAGSSYVQPGSVGYLGSPNDLTVYRPGGAAPADCSWQTYGLRCNDDNVAWDHVDIEGSVYWTGTGTLKVTNSIVRGQASQGWYALLGHTPADQAYPGATIDVEDSTLGFSGTVPGNVDSAPVWSAYGNQRQIIIRDDLSGMAQGIDPTDSSVIKDNYIHNLVQNGTGGTTVHLDGAFSQGGGNILIQGNYIDATHAPGAAPTGDTTAAVFIQDRGATDTGIVIKDNYLNGGAYVLRNQTGINVDVEGNTFGAGVYGLVGDLTGYPGTYGTWSGNVDASGATVAKP